MPTTSSRAGIPAPGLADAPNGPAQMQALADRVDSQLGAASLSQAARDGLSGVDRYVGRTIWNTTAGQFEVWDGSVWREALDPSQFIATTEGTGARTTLNAAREGSVSTAASPFTLDCGVGSGATEAFVYITRTTAMTINLANVPAVGDARSVVFVLYFTAAPPVTWSGAAFKFAEGEPPAWDDSALVTVTVMRGLALVSAAAPYDV